jgi:Zn-dependent M16 (insulinase) family peptidase
MWRLCREIGGRREYSVRAARQLQSEWKVGQDVGGFKVARVESIPEFDMTAIRLEHTGTKADYLHIARQDSNNVFSVGFRTTPTDSTGLPHILEHVTLCGSQKYPCRDPFFKMLNR